MSAPVKRPAKDAFVDQVDTSPGKHRRKRARHAKVKEEIELASGASSAPEEGVKITIPFEDRPNSTKGKVEPKSSPPIESNDQAPPSLAATTRIQGEAKKPSTRSEKTKRPKSHTGNYIGTHAVVKAGTTKSISASKKRSRNDNRWKLSTPTSGIFINQDPILAQQSEYIIVPTETNVHVYSAKTSLLARSMYVADNESITSCRLSPSTGTHLFVSTQSGTISKWEWTTGQKIQQWQCHPDVLDILEVLPVSESGSSNTLITVHGVNKHGQSRVIQSTLPKDTTSPVKNEILVDTRGSWAASRSLKGGDVLVLCSGKKMMLGNRPSSQGSNSSKPDYTWREVSVPEEVYSLDVQTRERSRSSGTGSDMVDVVLGCATGVIIIYEDILHGLIGKEKGIKQAEILSRRLHWHRHAVNTVKWSRDGNYLVSGGDETVLVIWQLDTSQKQFLPHLSTPILNLTISDRGSSYALRLADNSIMVLSTADLLPSANISGLALGSLASTVIAAAMNPRRPDQLLAAVHSDPLNLQRQPNSSATLLQTYDIVAGRQVSRQALVRNMTTALREAPDGQRVREPDVTHIATSHDGQWLVTVDEWSPNAKDLDALHSVNHRSERAQNGETSVRFWKWDEEVAHWELVTRVDEPHSRGHRTVFGLAMNPIKPEASTIGSDGEIFIWRPMVRVRDGIAVKNKMGEPLVTWNSSRSTQLEQIPLVTDMLADNSGALAYSEDGSTIAASWSWSTKSTRMVHFVNSRTGELCLSQPNVVTQGQAHLAFHRRQLLALSDKFCIWDTVALKTTFSISLKDRFISANSRHLAVNPFDNTFALALNPVHRSKPSAIAIFDLTEPNKGPKYQGEVFGHVRLLFPSVRATGYVLVDSSARIRRLATSGVNRSMTTMPVALEDEATKGLDDIFGARAAAGNEDQVVETDAEHKTMLIASGDQKRPKSLDSILASLASARPLPVREMFQQVISLFTKPRGGEL